MARFHRPAHRPAVRRQSLHIPPGSQDSQDTTQDTDTDSPLPSISLSNGPSIVKRSSSTCGSGDCEHPTSKATSALPIALGVVIPVVIAILVLIYLHRRHVLKLRREDKDDKFRSLDFGMGDVETVASRKKKSKRNNKNNDNNKNLDMEEKPHHRHADRGVSLDMSNPFLLPPGISASRDSFHSLPKSPTGDDDKYRHATSFLDERTNRSPGPEAGGGGIHHYNDPFNDSSVHLPPPADDNDNMDRNLLGNAQRMSQSSPPLLHTPANNTTEPSRNPFISDQDQEYEHENEHDRDQFQLNSPNTMTTPGLLTTDEAAGGADDDRRNSHVSSASSVATDIRKSNGYLSYFVRRESPTLEEDEEEEEEKKGKELQDQHQSDPANVEFVISDHSSNPSQFPLPPTMSSSSQHDANNNNNNNNKSNININQGPTQQPPRISLPMSDNGSDEYVINANGTDDKTTHHHDEESSGHMPPPRESTYAMEMENSSRDTRRFTFGLRPLPPEDPSEDPEQRANRIRSFYKEYFDPSRPLTGDYHEDVDHHGPDFYGDLYDPVSGIPSTYGLPRPFAEPVGRRAMTPPPREPPRFQGHSYGDSNFDLPSPRVNSSASNRLPGSLGGGVPRKPMPPPAPLQALPTPHMLKDDYYMQSIQFAPRGNYRDQREGRPDTPMGGLRPFSPSTRPHTPLASPFDELGVVPSPHALRISGTYSTLDFAPPPRFKTADTASDAGSIRSNRTGISAAHMFNIRNGAYRVSRLPSDNVGTKDDMYSNLRPRWDLGR